MPYKEGARVGAKVEYQESFIVDNQVTYQTKNTLDKYVGKSTDIEIKENYYGGTMPNNSYLIGFLPRDISVGIFEIANQKKTDVYFEKVDENDKKIKLKGATFGIQEPDGKYVYEHGNQLWKNLQKDGKDWTVTSDDKGIIKFEGLEFNKRYRIVEIKAPNGYIKQKIEIEFMVDINGKLLITKSKWEEEKYDNSESNPYQITNKKATYPSTGGPGVWIGFSLIGLAVMITGVLIYGKKKQKLA